MHARVYIYIYIYTHTHTHVHTHIRIHSDLEEDDDDDEPEERQSIKIKINLRGGGIKLTAEGGVSTSSTPPIKVKKEKSSTKSGGNSGGNGGMENTWFLNVMNEMNITESDCMEVQQSGKIMVLWKLLDEAARQDEKVLA